MTKEQQGNSEGYDRRIAIGTSVTDSAVVSGDGNIVTVTNTRIIQISVDEIKTHELNTTSPYKGLKKFEPGDVDRFFGRDQFLGGLVNELEQTNLILLLGASGSGKSSVVRAGLIPWLSQKWGARFVNFIFTPDQDPFEAFYGSLLSHYKQSEAQIAKAGEVNTLSHVVNTLKQPESFWFIFIDQFEELFITSDLEKRDRFINSLLRLSKERVKDGSIKIVATMRSDFLDQLDLYPANRLARATGQHRPLITQMQPDELRLAIEQPAAHHGVVFEPGLVEEIIKDVQGQAGYLPLLQYTLNRLWETKVKDGTIQNRTLNTSAYRQLGGVRGALQQRVDQIYGALSEPEQLAAQRIFLKLVEIGGNAESGTAWKPVRRRANRSEFSDGLEQKVLIQLINENLLVSNRPSQSQESTVEIAHEILLSSWTTLRNLIQENRKAIADSNRIREQWQRWKQSKSDDDLLRGSILVKAVELKEDKIFQQVLHGFGVEEEQFIQRSMDWYNRERRRTIIGLTLVAFTIAIAAIFAGIQWRESEKQFIISNSKLSESLSSSDRGFSALIASLRSGRELQRVRWTQLGSEVDSQVLTALQDAVYGIRESNTLEGHKGAVNSVSFSPDGQTLASASADGTIKLWDQHGKLLKNLEAHSGAIVYSVGFSPDGQTLASANADGTIQLWDLNGTLHKTLTGHSGAVYSVNFSSDGQTLASASMDGTIKLWNSDGVLLKTLTGHTGAVKDISFSPDSQSLASASADGTIKLWQLDGTLARTIKVSNRSVLRVGFSPDGQAITATSDDGNISFWSKDGKELVHLFQEGVVYHAIFSPDGKTIASGGGDTIVRLWSKDANLLHTFQGYTEGILGLAFSPDGQTIASASEDGTIKLWKRDSNWVHILQGHTDEVTATIFSPDGTIIASASHDKTIKLWNRNGVLIQTLTGHTDVIHGLSFSPDGKTIASASWDRTIKLWRVEDGHLLKTFTGHGGKIYGLSFSPDGKILASASNDGTIKFWNLDGTVLRTLRGHEDVVHNVSFSHDGKLLASASHDRTVKIWRVEDGKLLRTLTGHTNWVHKVDFSPDDQLLVSASWDRTIKLWRIQDGSLIRTFTGHTDKALGVSFSPDGKTIASSSDDKTLKLWRLDGTLIATLRGHSKAIHNVSFSPDGKTIASGGYDSTIILWDIKDRNNLDMLLNHGCGWVRDYLQNNPTLDQTRDVAPPQEVRHLCD